MDSLHGKVGSNRFTDTHCLPTDLVFDFTNPFDIADMTATAYFQDLVRFAFPSLTNFPEVEPADARSPRSQPVLALSQGSIA